MRMFSSIQRLRECGDHFYWCGMARCPRCAAQRNRKYRAQAFAALSGSPLATAYAVTLTLPSMPSQPLDAAWNDLDAVTDHLLSRSWLTAQAGRSRGGYVRTVEVTHPAPDRWHVHQHLLIVSRNVLPARFPSQLTARWIACARRIGIDADPAAQHAHQLDRSGVFAWAAYIHKGTTDFALIDAASTGDADAAESWAEFEHAADGRTTHAIGGGIFRHRRT